MFLPLNIYMVVASQLLGVAADQVPTYDFGQNCHSIATLNNSIERCANDEEDAHGKLRTLWADFSAADKERCETVTRAAWPSYVELLACLQIAQATNGIGARSSDETKSRTRRLLRRSSTARRVQARQSPDGWQPVAAAPPSPARTAGSVVTSVALRHRRIDGLAVHDLYVGSASSISAIVRTGEEALVDERLAASRLSPDEPVPTSPQSTLSCAPTCRRRSRS